MLNLLLATLAMMGLTFMIGFFVAGIIKAIANWADLLNLYHLHKKEILVLKATKKSHGEHTNNSLPGLKKRLHLRLPHKLNDTIDSLYPKKRVTA